MNIFNPKILDASIRDVSLCLSDNQKADLLLYALSSLVYEGRSRIVFENAIQSCLQVTSLSPENTAKARILRARARLNTGSIFGAQEDLQAALVAEPDNPEATALLHKRSVNVEKLLAPKPIIKGQFSVEIWREIASLLPRRDLKTLLFVPNSLSRIASQLLFRKLDLHFSDFSDIAEEEADSWRTPLLSANIRDQSNRHAQRTADILTRVITDASFASVVRTLRIFSFRSDKDGWSSFQIGILSNALPKLINLRNAHITAPIDGTMPILQILQTSHPRLSGLTLQIPNGSLGLSTLTLQHLTHFAYEASYVPSSAGGSDPSSSASSESETLSEFLSQNRGTLRTLCIENPASTFPATSSISIRNLTHIGYMGQLPVTSSQLIPDLLTHGRQLECLNLTVLLDCALSPYFRSLSTSLPFLRHFTLCIAGSVSRQLNDRDLLPSIADFLRNRRDLKTLSLTVGGGEFVLRSTGFDASIWGVLPSLTSLLGLTITYPKDLAPGLGAWLIPRTVVSLTLDGFAAASLREPLIFLTQLRPGIPTGLLFITLADFPLPFPAQVVEVGFPMVRLIRMGNNYFTVLNNLPGYAGGHRQYHRHDSSRRSSYSHLPSSNSSPAPSPVSTISTELDISYELEQWPKRRAVFHAREWFEWLGCEPGEAPDLQEFSLK
ncbi:MAG: hypothetical protein NXY57DRAFT_1107277 [Lentinula lateritia]|uniref:F-box domain-containing protein n=1 Tax=Lentinula lateritia TaxID=40482 RepID=A0ABQ8VEX8_9AGAR|nr:MAG: hypothetical protein NXY57DRAFT_1107277 [Lentinula lateritia]KAJ4482663.1 hypothetical protein C8R41DRAFT_922047 [Lentinula lateritia]